VNLSDFFDYLMRRDATHDLALQLAYVHDERDRRQSTERVRAAD
jgi:hypothetical protein